MELFLELLITLGVSLLLSFGIAKLFSMATACDATAGDKKTASVSVTGSIEEAVFRVKKRGEESVVLRDEGERSVCSHDEAVELRTVGEEESRAGTTGSSPLSCGGDEVVRNEEAECVGLENRISEGSGFMERAINVGGGEVEGKVFDESAEKEKFCEIRIESNARAETNPKTEKIREIEVESDKDGVREEKSGEVRVLEREDDKGNESGLESNRNDGGGEEEEEGFDDWEGVERTELEKRFGDAVIFVGSKSNAVRVSSIDSETQMQLYGLHKVAIEGPCHSPSPMALKVSARAKWNAWQQFGEMSREEAMEKYISLLSMSIPGWMGDDAKDGKQILSDVGSANVHNQLGTENESTSEELKPGDKECGMIGSTQIP